MPARILVLDHDKRLRDAVVAGLRSRGHEVEVFGALDEGLAGLAAARFDAAVVGLSLPACLARDVTPRLQQAAKRARILLLVPDAPHPVASFAASNDAVGILPRDSEPARIAAAVDALLTGRPEAASLRPVPDSPATRSQALVVTVMQLSTIIELGREMEGIRDPGAMCEFFVDSVASEFSAERVSVMMIDEASGDLAIVAQRGISEIDVASVRIPVGKGVVGLVAHTGNGMLVTDVENDKRMTQVLPSIQGRSFLCAPISLDGEAGTDSRVIGVVNVTNRTDGSPFGTADLSYLTGLVGQFAHAMTRSRDVATLQRDLLRLRQRFDAAVQHSGIQAITGVAERVSQRLSESLSVILTRTDAALELAATEPVDQERLPEMLRSIRSSAVECSRIVRQIHDYASISQDQPREELDVGEVIEAVLEAWRASAADSPDREVVPTTVEMQPGCRVRGNRGELMRAIELLLENCDDSLAPGGSVRLGARRRDENVEILVSDDGEGMPHEVLLRVMEPYFTTRPGRPGLGASMAAGIAARHGGGLVYESSPGRGTIARMRLPAASGAEASFATDDALRGAHARVLLVEDEETVRGAVAEALEIVGYEVQECGTAEQALAAVKRTTVDLLVTDVGLPTISGVELVRRLRESGHDFPVMLLTGRNLDSVEGGTLENLRIRTVIRKPCTMRELVSAIRAELQSGSRVKDSASPA